jgi:hypothetical protein
MLIARELLAEQFKAFSEPVERHFLVFKGGNFHESGFFLREFCDFIELAEQGGD